MIVEFNGLPGTGKSTIAGQIKQHLLPNHNVILRYAPKQARLIRYISYMFDGSIPVYLSALSYARKAADNYDSAKRKCASLVVAYYRMYKSFPKKHTDSDILLIDQGLVQALVSIHHADYITDTHCLDKIIHILKKRNIHFISVNCNNDISISCERINSRPTNGSRLDTCDEQDRKQILMTQSKNFEIIRNRINVIMDAHQNINVDTRISADINAYNIAQILTSTENTNEENH